jgi:phosphoethanolamine N-methyltransferase
MGATVDGELYHDQLIGLLELIWGEGFLSPGGPDEVAEVVAGIELAGRSVLDIGCGLAGAAIELVRRHEAAHVLGIDVERTVCARARERVDRAGSGARIGVVEVAPGRLPFADRSFDVVFSKDSIVHIPDKETLAADVFRVLRPGGWFVASDWLIGHDGEPSAEMAAYLAAEGLDFGMASPSRYAAALADAGFVDIGLRSRNEWYREVARRERELLAGERRVEAVAAFGEEFVDHNLEIWERMIVVLDTGEHQPTHLRGRRPAEE